MWFLYRAEIISKRFTESLLSTRILLTSHADYRLRTLFCLLTFLFVSPCTNLKGDNIPRVNSWRRKYTRFPEQTESVYLGYSGDPWGTVSAPVNPGHHRTRFSLKKEKIYATKNDSKTTKIPSASRVNSSINRSRRGVVHLYNMVFCATGCNPLAYKGYGCYCGFLGSGYTTDGIDRCCKMHDWCYDATNCPMFMEYFVPYYWKCYRGNKPICAIEHGQWGGSGSCAQRLCECDRALGECLRRYPCPKRKAVCTSSPWRLVQNLFMLM